MQDILEVAAAVIVAVGGAGAIVVALANWLAARFAERSLERLRSQLAQEREAELDVLRRKRDVYARTMNGLRVFLGGGNPSDRDITSFHEAYHELFLWAPDVVAEAVGEFLDTQHSPGSRSSPEAHDAFDAAALAMRRDAGFSDSGTSLRRFVVVRQGTPP